LIRIDRTWRLFAGRERTTRRALVRNRRSSWSCRLPVRGRIWAVAPSASPCRWRRCAAEAGSSLWTRGWSCGKDDGLCRGLRLVRRSSRGLAPFGAAREAVGPTPVAVP